MSPEPSESRASSACGREGQVCEPTGVRVDRVLLFEGPREVHVIEECHCENKISQCVRTPALRTYYFETPYETVVDVGACSKSKGPVGVYGHAWTQTHLPAHYSGKKWQPVAAVPLLRNTYNTRRTSQKS